MNAKTSLNQVNQWNDAQMTRNSGCSMKGVQTMRNSVEMLWEKGETG